MDKDKLQKTLINLKNGLVEIERNYYGQIGAIQIVEELLKQQDDDDKKVTTKKPTAMGKAEG